MTTRTLRDRVVERWSGATAAAESYPARCGRWPDDDHVDLLRRLCTGVVCEIGCGTGRCAEAFTPETYIGLDINEAAIEAARAEHPGYDFRHVEWEDYYPEADTYLFHTTLLHVPDDELNEVLRRTAERVVIVEWMDPRFRDEEKLNFNRSVEDYEAALTRCAYEVVAYHALPTKYQVPGRPELVRRVLVAEHCEARDPILVTGVPRSGISMTAGVLQISGAFGGELIGPSKYNEKGMFENRALRETVLKPLLVGLGGDAGGQLVFPDQERCRNRANGMAPQVLRQRVLRIMREQGLRDDAPWLYKDAKLSLSWQVWAAAFPSSPWVIVRRTVRQIAQSCLGTDFMRARTTFEGWLEWISSYELRLEGIKRSGLDFTEVWPEELIAGESQGYKDAIEHLELQWDQMAVMDFVAPAMWRHGHFEMTG